MGELPERDVLVAAAAELVARGAVHLETEFAITKVVASDDGVLLRSDDGRSVGPFDEVISVTGFRPDTAVLSELQIDLDPALESSRHIAPFIDPEQHDCRSVPLHGAADLVHAEPDLFVVGAKSYGQAPTFLLSTGYQRLRSVLGELDKCAPSRLLPPLAGR